MRGDKFINHDKQLYNRQNSLEMVEFTHPTLPDSSASSENGENGKFSDAKTFICELEYASSPTV